ncbi:MAG TPA: ROK family protein [Blastocatellia bacterium]|nr:ROK family protein [Blastocatellia bacterium]
MVRLESDIATARLVKVDKGVASLIEAKLGPKDMRTVRGSEDSNRINEVIASFTNQAMSELNVRPDIVSVSCPGTIDIHCQTIIRSSRLGILQPLNCGELLNETRGIGVYLFNDAICIARIELRNMSGGKIPDSAVFIMVGQGVGSAIYLGGELYAGAGAGGHIGRIVVNPDGPISQRFNQRGTLESYTSHESIVQRLIGEHQNEMEKTSDEQLRRKPYFRFRQILQAAKRPLDVRIPEIATALDQGDPLVTEAVDDAARYLGQCISYIITLLNPNLIVVGGELIDGLSTYFDRAASSAKRYSSRLAWETTKLVKASQGVDAQFLGAAELASIFLDSKQGIPIT